MAVYRVQRTRDYTVMSNYHLKDKGLTLKSKGLLSMILSLPEEWNYTISMVIALLGVAVLLTCSLQNGIILLVMAFLISPYGLPMAAIWLLGKVQDLKFAIQDLVYG